MLSISVWICCRTAFTVGVRMIIKTHSVSGYILRGGDAPLNRQVSDNGYSADKRYASAFQSDGSGAVFDDDRIRLAGIRKSGVDLRE